MLTFLKLGGSLITDKHIPFSARKQTIKRLGLEIVDYLENSPEQKLLIGHGSGSFGHAAGSEFGTIHGVKTDGQWRGFQSVWWAAHQLNQIVCEIFTEIGLPIVSLPASSSVVSSNHSVHSWFTGPIESCLGAGLIPVIYGDVVFDQKIGGTILSTEELFASLVTSLNPSRILLAGIENGVFRDYPQNTDLITRITEKSFQNEQFNLESSAATDVTGGMAAKVEEMLEIIKIQPRIEIQIFSGEQPLDVSKALAGAQVGTIISA